MKFSRNYYCRPYYIYRNSDVGIINEEEYEQIELSLFNTTRAENPIIMKLGNVHFKVIGKPGVEKQNLYAPDKAIEQADISRIPDKAPVLLPTKEAIEKLL